MANKQVEVTISAKLKWWTIPALRIVVPVCKLLGIEPDTEKLAKWIAKHGVQYVVR